MKSTYKKCKHKHTKKCRHVKKHKHTKKCRHTHKHKRSSHKRSSHLHKRSSHLRKRHHLKGGYGPGAGPLGFAWVGKDVNTWPGVAGVDGQSNYLPLSKDGVPAGLLDPPISTRNSVQGGGGLSDLMPQDLVNVGRSLTGGVQGIMFGFEGVDRPYSTFPLPTNQPGMNSVQTNYSSTPPNINAIHQAAGKTVAAL